MVGAMTADRPGGESIGSVNAAAWARSDRVAEYASRELRPPEAIVMLRHRDALSGSVLELGCGAGRLTGYLAVLSDDVVAIDISPAMVAYCRRAYPSVRCEVADLRDLSAFSDRRFDAIVAGFNVLGILDHDERGALLGTLHGLLAPSGLLVMSSHNLPFAPRLPSPLRIRARDPLRVARNLAAVPRRVRNRRRMRPLERTGDGYAMVNDDANDFGLLHYWTTRDAQEAQLAQAGFELVECLDGAGDVVPAGATAEAWPELHYVARRL
jgi:SAM-dependent methyltransferase